MPRVPRRQSGKKIGMGDGDASTARTNEGERGALERKRWNGKGLVKLVKQPIPSVPRSRHFCSPFPVFSLLGSNLEARQVGAGQGGSSTVELWESVNQSHMGSNKTGAVRDANKDVDGGNTTRRRGPPLLHFRRRSRRKFVPNPIPPPSIPKPKYSNSRELLGKRESPGLREGRKSVKLFGVNEKEHKEN